MFWSGNYMVVRELNYLLKEENVTLTQVLEADDILHECQADNKALMQFLTEPKNLAELITLITEEPPKNVELASQYKHASIACEVLTSHLSTLSDRLSMNVVQMNRLCDFINRDPPLNPLLASYFSKTVEMLLERSPKQDWYLYHIVCLRVLEFFKSRRDFLPNLLRHISTSAIADTFKYFIRLDDLFNKIIMEWFEEHQFLECLIQIICGTYVPEPVGRGASAGGEGARQPSPDQPEKGQLEASEKADADRAAHDGRKDVMERNGEVTNEARQPGADAQAAVDAEAAAAADAEAEAERRAERIAGVASANAAALLCDLILSGCAGDGYNTRARTSWALVGRLAGAGAAQLLGGMFTAPPRRRRHALVHGAHVLLALLDRDPAQGGEWEAERTSVEACVAPHLPLLHQALLAGEGQGEGEGEPRVGLARVQVAALLAHLALSEVEEVCTTMITLGTMGVVLELFFRHAHNNFLHAQTLALVRHALANPRYRAHYAAHLLVECDLLTRLIDAYEENENQKSRPRAGYMGHVVQMLRCVDKALEDAAVQALLPAAALQRHQHFRHHHLEHLLQRLDTPLGGYYPSENTYEFNERMEDVPADINADDNVESLATAVPQPDMNKFATPWVMDEMDVVRSLPNDEFNVDHNEHEQVESKNNFLELASQRFDDDVWEDSPSEEGADIESDVILQAREVLAQPSPWESSGGALEGDGSGAGGVGGAGAREGEAGGGGGGAGGEGWAQFDAPAHDDHFWPYTQQNTSHDDIEENMRNLQLENDFSRLEGSSVELANKLLTAMSSMPPHLLASLVSPASPAPVTPPVPDDKLDPFEDDFVAKETPAIVEEATTEQKTDPPSIDGSKSEEKSPEPRKETEPSEDPAQRAEETIPETPSVDAPLENCSAPATECSDDRR